MTNKDEASPRQRQIMEERWKKAREDCPAGKCLPASRFHVAGCERRTQKVKVTNLNTGVTSEATIRHWDGNAVKDVLDQYEKQAVKLTPLHEEVTFPGDEYWDEFEKGEPGARIKALREHYDNNDTSAEMARDVFTNAVPDGWGDASVAAPARPWWKFWGRRG